LTFSFWLENPRLRIAISLSATRPGGFSYFKKTTWRNQNDEQTGNPEGDTCVRKEVGTQPQPWAS
jgi:hypothetical protein